MNILRNLLGAGWWGILRRCLRQKGFTNAGAGIISIN
jgi:hypothetical protein